MTEVSQPYLCSSYLMWRYQWSEMDGDVGYTVVCGVYQGGHQKHP